MAAESLSQALDEAANPIEMLREAGGRWEWPDDVSREYTQWIDELRAIRKTCVLADLSHHQMDQVIEGPDATEVLRDLCTNSFEGFDVGKAKQAVMCDPRGYFIGDGILQHVGEERYVLSGKSPAANWLAYHVKTGEYDASETMYPKSSETSDDPHFFTYQVQGPSALAVFEEAIDGPLPDIPFFNFERVSIDGIEVRALRHGMAGEPGFELQGPYERGAEIKDEILNAGRDHDIRRLGTRAYEPLSVMLGWPTTWVLPIYDTDPRIRDYQRWLDADGYEGSYSIAGSYTADDIRDYYMTPVDLGYDHLISFDHDFIGMSALEEEIDDPQTTRVTLVWDDQDAIDIYASLFTGGTPNKFINLPRDRWGAQYDEVLKNGERIGISKSFAYSYDSRQMLSLCSIDLAHSEPGTEVTIVWGEDRGESPNPTVESHSQTEIRATVAPSPYITDER